MKNDIDNTTEEYASDLKKKIEQAKLEKEAKLKQESEEVADDFHNINNRVNVTDNSVDRLKDIKNSFENNETEDVLLETVEFEIGPEMEKSDGVEETKVISTSSNLSPSDENEEEEKEALSPEEKKRNKIILISIISVLVVTLSIVLIVGFNVFGGKSKDDATSEVTSDKEKEKAKKEKEEKDKKEKEEKDKEKEDASINDAQRTALEGQINSNLASIATLEGEINGYRDEISTLTTKITQLDGYKSNLNTLNGPLKQQYENLVKQSVGSEEYIRISNEISTSLDSMGCVSIISDTAISSCVTHISGNVFELTGEDVSLMDQSRLNWSTRITNVEGIISSKTSEIARYKSDNEAKQKELNALN